jgi:hypothetical protein
MTAFARTVGAALAALACHAAPDVPLPAQRAMTIPGSMPDTGFAAKIGLYAQPARPAGVGLTVDWREVPSAIAAARPGWATEMRPPRAQGRGEGVLQLLASADERRVRLVVRVFADGQEAARRALDQTGNLTMMVASPYIRPPQPLGDYAAVLVHAGQTSRVFWVYANALLELRSSDESSVWDVALALQQFMEGRLSDQLPTRVPRVAGVDVAPLEVRAGSTFTATLRPAAGQSAALWTTAVDDVEGPARLAGSDAGTASFVAEQAGQVRIRFSVVDAATLLATAAVLDVTVAPAR